MNLKKKRNSSELVDTVSHRVKAKRSGNIRRQGKHWGVAFEIESSGSEYQGKIRVSRKVAIKAAILIIASGIFVYLLWHDPEALKEVAVQLLLAILARFWK